MASKIIETVWFPGAKGLCGIVVTEDEVTGERRGYVGVAFGLDEDVDANMVKDWGVKLFPRVLRDILAKLEAKPEPKKGNGQ